MFGTTFEPSGGSDIEYLPMGVYVDHNPITAMAAYPYSLSMDVNFTPLSWIVSLSPQAPNDNVNFWTINFKTQTLGTVLATFNTSNILEFPVGVWTLKKITTFLSNFIALGNVGVYIECLKSTPATGTLYMYGSKIGVRY